jgi:uncharacterized protein YecE (DUF72 family)
MPFDREQIKKKTAALATKGVYIGTSSWKYEGWLGQVYTASRYTKLKKASKQDSDEGFFPQMLGETKSQETEQFDGKRFDKECLSEYAETFKTVSVDSAYYTFPRRESLQKLADAVPKDFRFGFKVTETITVKRYPNLDKSGARAGQLNPGFLDADLFTAAFLKPCEEMRENLGVLMFEFSRFHSNDYKHGRDFISDLDGFLGKLPKGWPYAVEMRNKDWLQNEYFDCLAKHGVTHVYNNWEAMPSVEEQMAIPGSRTNPKLLVARFLLRPGRKYQEAVNTFKPYDKVKEHNPEARKAGWKLVCVGVDAAGCELYVYVNNRLEGNAPETIDAMLEVFRDDAT